MGTCDALRPLTLKTLTAGNILMNIGYGSGTLTTGTFIIPSSTSWDSGVSGISSGWSGEARDECHGPRRAIWELYRFSFFCLEILQIAKIFVYLQLDAITLIIIQ